MAASGARPACTCNVRGAVTGSLQGLLSLLYILGILLLGHPRSALAQEPGIYMHAHVRVHARRAHASIDPHSPMTSGWTVS